MLPPLSFILLITAVWSYREAVGAAGEAYDRSLTMATRIVTDRLRVSGNAPIAFEPGDDLVDGLALEDFFYAVFGPDGTLLAGEADLRPPPGVAPMPGVPVKVDAQFRNREIRMNLIETRLRAYEPTSDDTAATVATLVLAETTEGRDRLTWRLFTGNLIRQFLLIAAVVAALLFALVHSLRPLFTLHESIRRRNTDDLTPLPTENVPTEMRPLVDAINHHLSQLAHLLKTRQRFLADAAHQIRTPLTVLQTQTEYGERQHDPEEMRRTFVGMLASIRSARHTANQMLVLANAGEMADAPDRERTVLNLAQLTRDVASDFAPLALQKRIEMAFETTVEPQRVEGSATMLREMIANLIDNALRYTPDGGRVTLTVAGAGIRAALYVTDDGPGIPVTERGKVFQRFYRILGSGDSQGSGLGLCIVQEICTAHGGTIELHDGPNGRGLTVEIILPRVKAW